MKRLSLLTPLILMACEPNAPTAPGVSIAPDVAYTTDDLTLEGLDKLPENSNYTITWLKDGQRQADESAEHTAVISSESTSKNEVWKAVLVVEKDGVFSEEASAELTILNSSPTVDTLEVDPVAPTTNDPLRVVVSGQDADSDPLSFTYQWFKDGALQIDLTNPLVSADLTIHGETWRIESSAHDGETSGESVSLEVVIGNSAPEIQSITISPEAPATGDNLEVSANVFDAEDDAITLTYNFSVGGSVFGPQESSVFTSDNFERGDTVVVEVIATDGPGLASEPVSAEVTIGNTPPSTGAFISGFSQTVSSGSGLYTDSQLWCYPENWVDPDDGDPQEWTITWKVNGQEVSGAPEELDGTDSFDRGDTVQCILTPSDGIDQGESAETSEETIQNAPPVYTGLSLAVDDATDLDPMTLTEEHVLSAVFDGLEDADGDSVTTSVTWYKDVGGNGTNNGNGFAITGADPNQLTGADFNRDDWVRAVVDTVTDGIDNGIMNGGPQGTAWWTVVNAAPVVTHIDLDYEEYRLHDSILASYTANDPDGDSIHASEYNWYVNGTFRLLTTVDNTTPVELGAVKYDMLHVEVVVEEDGQSPLTSQPGVSDASGIVDTPPEVSIQDITASELDNTQPNGLPRSNSTLTCRFELTDVDVADVETYTVEWQSAANTTSFETNGGTTTSADPTTTTNTAELDLSLHTFAHEELIRCVVTPTSDGVDGTTDSAEVTLGNSRPVISGLTLSPAVPTTDTILNVAVTAHPDHDGDALSWDYTWYVNAQERGGENTSSLNGADHFDRGNDVEVSVQAWDGYEYSDTITDDVTIANSPPAGLEAIIKPEAPIEAQDPIVCEVLTDATDPDGDTVNYAVSWEVDDDPTTGLNLVAYTGNPATTNPDLTGDTIVSELVADYVYACTITPTDSEGLDGTAATAQVTITPDPCTSGAQSFSSRNGDYIEIGDTDGDGTIDQTGTLGGSSGTDDFTIEAWVYPESPGAVAATPGKYFIGAIGADGYSAESWEIGFQYGDFFGRTGSAITASFYEANGQSVTLYSLEELEQPTDGYWHHVAVTRELASNQFKYRLYVDGLLVHSQPRNSSNVLATMTGPIDIGRGNHHTQGPMPWDGYIDEVRISDAALYTGPSFELEARLAVTNDTLALYRFDSDTSTTATDDSGGIYGDGRVSALSNSYFWPDSACNAKGDIVHIDAGEAHTCWLDEQGSIDCWGLDTNDQISEMPASGTFIDVSAGMEHSCALDTSGCIQCWGTYGDGGDNRADGQPNTCGWESITAGYYHSCVLNSAGTINCWGQNNFNQTGGTPSYPAAQVETKASGSCAIKQSNGSIQCWGGSSGTDDLRADEPTGSYGDIAVGFDHGCAVKNSGVLKCWGNDGGTWGKVDDAPNTSDASTVGVSRYTSCATYTDNSLQCWGHAVDGKTSPPMGQYVSTVGGANHHCALTSLGRVRCWGNNTNGNQTGVPTH